MKEYKIKEMQDLVFTYAEQEALTFPGEFTHRLDVVCSKMLYSMIREYKPKTCLEFGTSWGGSALVMLKALVRNDLPYSYVGFEIEEALLQETRRNLVHWLNAKPPPRIYIETFGDITQNMDKIPKELDCVFIDPNWDKEIAVWTYENIIPRVKKGGLVCIHDWSVTRDLVYEGGIFPGINYFIELFKENKMPLKKLFAVWDWEEYKKMSIALSFWEKL